MRNSATNLINLQDSFVGKRQQKVCGARSKNRRLRVYKAISVMAFMALLGGLAFSLWFGANIDRNLKMLAEVNQAADLAMINNRELKQRKARLFSKEHVQAAAAVKLNLYCTEEKQSGIDGVKVRL